MLTEETVIDKIEILENGVVQVRTATRVLRDGVEIASTFHRESFCPGQDVSKQDKKIQAHCGAAWSEDVIKQYCDALAATEASMAPLIDKPKK